MKKTMKKVSGVARKHPKKTATLGLLVGFLTVTLSYWSQLYPVVCPLFKDPTKCMQVGAVVRAVDHSLDGNNKGEVQLDVDGGVDGGTL